jgi:hypothetical protein
MRGPSIIPWILLTKLKMNAECVLRQTDIKYNAVPSDETPSLRQGPNEHDLGLYDIPMNI